MHEREVTIEDLVGQLKAVGLRTTTARRAVLVELVAAGDTHVSAEQLAARIQQRHPAIHLSTIYRTLDALIDGAIITLARVADRPATYHLTSDAHHHATCSSCGTTLNLPPTVFEPLRRRLLRDHGFHADPRHLTIVGLCQACADA